MGPVVALPAGRSENPADGCFVDDYAGLAATKTATILPHHRYGHLRTWLWWGLVLLSAPVYAAVAPTPDRLVEFRIKDQFDRLHTSGYYRNAVVVLIAGDRQGSTYIGQWLPALSDSLATAVAGYRVKFLTVANVEGVPFFMKSMDKTKLPQMPDQWRLLDYAGLFKEAYDLPDDRCSLVVFDRQGVLRLQKTVTDFDPAVQAEVLVVVRRLAAP